MKTLKTRLQISLLLVLLMPLFSHAQVTSAGNGKKSLKDKLCNICNEESNDSSHCITFDFCQSTCNVKLTNSLKNLGLKKGDFFTVKIKNINPYLYNVNVNTKHDTMQLGSQPQLFTDFLDRSKLAEITANLSSALAAVVLPKPDSINPNNKKNQANHEIALISFAREQNSLKEQKSKVLELTGYLDIMERNYQAIVKCYLNSGLKVLQTKVSCSNMIENDPCLPKIECDCLGKEFSKRIDTIQQMRKKSKEILNELLSQSTIKGNLKDTYTKLQTEVSSQKFDASYLQNIYSKTYSNWLIAKDTEVLSTYNSMPIQVQGDYLELKIDITPKAAAGDKKEEEKKSEEATSDKITNQSPLNININTGEKAAAATTNTTDPKEASDASAEQIAAEDLKISFPAATIEWHLNYKFRTGQWFFGFGSGFFVDWLQDANYTNKPIDPLNSNTQFFIVKENNASTNKYGSYTSFNVGRYLSKCSKSFVQLTFGPGVTIETKVQPRLLFGLGLGGGEQHKISINAGLAFGEVKKLSNAYDLKQAYAVPQENLYYSSLGVKAFISVGYIYNLQFK